MSELPKDILFTETHEWVRKDDKGCYYVGITDHAQELLGDIVFVELPEEDESVSQGEECCVIESVKTAADVYAPLSGKILEVNEQITDAPALVNKDPFADGWLFKIAPSDDEEVNSLHSAEAYAEKIAEEE